MKPLVVLGGAIVVILAIILAFNSKPAEEAIKVNDSTQSGSIQSGSTQKKSYNQFPGVLGANELQNRTALIKTSKGDIAIEFFGTEAPKATSNFIFLANERFYDGLTFHRREEGFVIQGGDPEGTGRGGPGYKFEDEPVSRNYDRGIVAMANAGPDTNGSQFFIMLKDTPLPKNYTIFGRVTSGIDVVDKIQVGDEIEKVTIN